MMLLPLLNKQTVARMQTVALAEWCIALPLVVEMLFLPCCAVIVALLIAFVSAEGLVLNTTIPLPSVANLIGAFKMGMQNGYVRGYCAYVMLNHASTSRRSHMPPPCERLQTSWTLTSWADASYCL